MKFYTRSNGVIDIFTEPEKIKVDDLIYGVESLNRFCSQVPWKVSQHSCLVANLARLNGESPGGVLACLMHDLSEGLLGDIQKPLRDKMSSSLYEKCHDSINNELAKRYFQTYNPDVDIVDWTSMYDGTNICLYDKYAFWIEYYYFIHFMNNENAKPIDFGIPDNYFSILEDKVLYNIFQHIKDLKIKISLLIDLSKKTTLKDYILLYIGKF